MKPNAPILYCAMASLTMSVCSCNPGLYSTVGQNVPLLKQKGEVSISGGRVEAQSTGDVIRGFNVQAAVAIDSGLAVMASAYAMKASGDWSGRGTFMEVGIGKFASGKVSGKVVREIFVGAGLGSVKNWRDREYVDARFLKPFIQPSIGFTSRYFDAAITTRLAMVSYLSHGQVLDSENSRLVADFFNDKKNTLVFEPGITLRAGFKNVKVQLQSSYSTFSYEADNFDPVYDWCYGLNVYIIVTDRWLNINRRISK